MLKSRLTGLLAGLVLSGVVMAQDVLLRSDHPSEYIVKQGDTLWDISKMFLNEPWMWPEIWHVNPQVENPHLIFPGDRLVLTYRDGRPILTAQRNRDYLKLKPEIRSSPLDLAIPTIPLEQIQQYLSRSRAVLSRDEIDGSPYVVHMVDNRVIGDLWTRLYVRAISGDNDRQFSIFRAGEPLRAFGSNNLLGYQIVHVGEARLVTTGDPARVDMVSSTREVLVGDRILKLDDYQLPRNFYPRLPDFNANARIIAVLDGVSQIGQYNTVVLDRGSADGFEPGHALVAYRASQQVRDTVSGVPNDMVTIPRERNGRLLIYRTFERVSYALVMDIERPLHIHDEVGLPE